MQKKNIIRVSFFVYTHTKIEINSKMFLQISYEQIEFANCEKFKYITGIDFIWFRFWYNGLLMFSVILLKYGI